MSDFRIPRASALLALLGVLAVSVGGCVDEEDVFGDDRPVTADPQPAANGFLGYTQAKARVTICGNCHAQPQAEWVGTAHANAWESLAANPGAQAFCEGCHTVSERGNPATEPSGWTATGDIRYLDVQCESCHGAGLGHVENPAASQPIPSIRVTDESGAFLNCAQCHNGTHHPFVEQWLLSAHALPNTIAAGRAECAGCHVGQDVLLAWGVRADYAEKGSDEPLPIVCSVCHDPHDATFTGQLRFPVETSSIETHLCARCHNRRSVPDPNTRQGLAPHSPESELLIGEAGWFPPGADFAPGTIVGTHGSPNNEVLCAACHLEMFEVTDPASGGFLFQSVGHTFRALPCTDANGIPDGSKGCALTLGARDWRGCVDSGCHSNAESARVRLQSRLNIVGPRSEELRKLLEIVDPNLGAPGGEIDATNPTFTVAEGAFFNLNLANHRGSQLGSATHNASLTIALLNESIRAVEREYGISLP